MPNSPQSSGYEVLGISGQPQGRYFGEVTFKAPSGSICTVPVYRYTGTIYFGDLDGEALSPGNLLHETQIAMREALRAGCPESFIDDVDDPEPEAKP